MLYLFMFTYTVYVYNDGDEIGTKSPRQLFNLRLSSQKLANRKPPKHLGMGLLLSRFHFCLSKTQPQNPP